MPNIHKNNYSVRLAGKFGFLRGSLPAILAWPVVCLILGLLLWGATFSKISAEKRQLEKNALRDASFLASAYAQYLAHAIEQIDQITMLIKHQWEHSDKALRLENSFQIHSFPASRHLHVNLIGRKGETITRSFSNGRRSYIADRDYFIFHKNEKTNVLFVGVPTTSRSTGQTVIHFSRRLEAADGSFDGLVVVSVQPEFFSAFYGGSKLGQTGFLAMVGKDGGLRTSTIGDGTHESGTPALVSVPVLASGEGARLMEGTPWFADRQARFVGWHALNSYPFVAMVGLAQDERLAPYQETWETYKTYAFVGSFFLLIFALVGTILSSRLAWRKHHAEKAREEYGIATEGGTEGFYLWRALRDRTGTPVDFEVVDCNERGATFYGLNKAQLLGRNLSAFYEDQSFFAKLMQTWRHAIELGFYEDEYQVPSQSPFRARWLHRKMVRSKLGLAVTIRDISEMKEHQRELLRLANEDELTGLPNRNWLVNFLSAALERANGTGSMLAILFIDIDNFKDVNDTLGHTAGDELLRAASAALRSALRPADNVARLGGDEFTIILENVANEAAAAATASRIVEAFNEPFELSRGKHVVGASVGISLFPRDGKDAETLLKNADIAMYSVKNSGKRHYRFFDDQLFHRLKHRLDMEQALLQALEQDQFILFYQPRVRTATGEICGMEALVRWQHPERGLVPPLEFIPMAESTGLILRLGELVMEKACAQLAHWRRQGLPLVPVSINVSARQFNQGNIRQSLSACLARHEIPAELIEVELTESTMMGEQSEIIAELTAIRALGIKLLVDDFGTGYSSLSQLQRIDMDVLKVDRAFTAELAMTTEGEIFFKAIMSMAHALGMTVVAEGVETRDQLRVLQALSCDEIQGYLVSRPLPADEVQPMMLKRFLFPAF